MTRDTELLEGMYEGFNARDMDAVLAKMQPDVAWANGLEGGYVHGRDGVRDYWTRQWASLDTRAAPKSYSVGADGRVEVEVHLTAQTHDGEVVFDKTGVHIFQIDDGLITRFDIR